MNKLKYMANPGDNHWRALKHLLRYLKGTLSFGLHYDYGHSDEHVVFHKGLHGFTDSSFADCIDTGRSTLAYVFFFDRSILSWYSKLNSYVTTCTNHSEYNALALGAKEAEWLVLLYGELDTSTLHTPVPLLVDNSGIIAMVFNPVDHKSNKHVRIGCHYTRELTENKVIAPIRVPTDANIADIFTKALAAPAFKKFARCIVSLIEQVPKVSTTILMFTHSNNATEVNDATSADSDSESPATDEGPHSTPPSTFQRDWPYANIVKNELHADGFDAIQTDDAFSSGRKKYHIIFYTKPVLAGSRIEISRHVGMKLVSRKGSTYFVCQRAPIDVGPHLPMPYTPIKSVPTSTIAIVPPRPCLMCCNCGANNTVQHAQLACLSCTGNSFVWSCACTGNPALFAAQPEFKQTPQHDPLVSLPRRPTRPLGNAGHQAKNRGRKRLNM